MSWVIWHNPRCRKSRETLQLLRDNGVEPTIRLYLEDQPTTSELKTVLQLLDLEPRGLMRTKESVYKELGLRDSAVTGDQLLSAMIEHPKLIERPVVIRDSTAALGRPPENVLALL